MYASDREILQRVTERYEVEDILEILELTDNIDVEDILDMQIEDVVKVYKRKILNNIELFDVL